MIKRIYKQDQEGLRIRFKYYPMNFQTKKFYPTIGDIYLSQILFNKLKGGLKL